MKVNYTKCRKRGKQNVWWGRGRGRGKMFFFLYDEKRATRG